MLSEQMLIPNDSVAGVSCLPCSLLGQSPLACSAIYHGYCQVAWSLVREGGALALLGKYTPAISA